MHKYLKTADAVLMPSVDLETLGMVTLESLSFGTPVIGVPSGATSEILEKVNPKLMAGFADGKALAKTIHWFISLSRHEKEELSRSSVKYAGTFHDPEKTLAEFNKIFN